MDRLTNNFHYLNNYIGESKVLAVVKANAYGHGAIKVAQKLENVGVDGLCVAMAEELVELRQTKISVPILHLGVLNKKNIDLYESKNNICTINSSNDIDLINDFLKGTNKKIKIGIRMAINEEPQSSYYTSRMGIRPAEIIDFYKVIYIV